MPQPLPGSVVQWAEDRLAPCLLSTRTAAWVDHDDDEPCGRTAPGSSKKESHTACAGRRGRSAALGRTSSRPKSGARHVQARSRRCRHCTAPGLLHVLASRPSGSCQQRCQSTRCSINMDEDVAAPNRPRLPRRRWCHRPCRNELTATAGGEARRRGGIQRNAVQVCLSAVLCRCEQCRIVEPGTTPPPRRVERAVKFTRQPPMLAAVRRHDATCTFWG